MNALEALAGSVLIQRLGWTLLHSLWQVLAVAIGLALVLAAVRRRSARAAYAVSCLALVLCLVLPAATFPLVSLPAPRPAPVALNFRSTALSAIGPEALPIAGVKSSPLAARRHRPLRIFTEHPSAAPDVERSPAATIALADRGTSLAAETPRPSFYERARASARKLEAQATLWLPWSVVAWTAGVLAVSLWNLGAWFAVQRLKSRQTNAVSSAIQESAAGLARRLGLTRTIRILQSALVDSPMVIGALKPVILLPASLITQLPSDQLESLLAHELAHVLRQDYLVNLLQSLIETLLFYHPAVWWISHQVRAERENCCDDLAVNVAHNRDVYVRALAAVAGARTSAMAPAAAGGILLPRLRRILGVADSQAAHPSRWLTGGMMLVLASGAIALVALNMRSATAQSTAATPPQKDAPAKANSLKTAASKTEDSKQGSKPARAARSRRLQGPQFPTKGSMRVQIVDTAGKPLANAAIHASIWTNEVFQANRDYQTDAQGFATVLLPKALQILRLWASKEEYCGEFVNFQTNTAVHEVVIPDDYKFRLVKGTLIGGVVKNEEGRPIAGAKVAYCHDGVFFNDDTVTDVSGRWKFDNVRPGNDVFIRVTHPDYVSDHFAEMQKAQKVTTAMLRAQTATIVLRRGLRIAGKVVDPQGKPVKHAILLSGDDPYLGGAAPPVVSDDQGQFQFPTLAAGTVRLTVIAKGWMPETRQIQLAPGMGATDLHLKPGKKLRIRFVDRDGEPIPRVGVSIERWNGVRNLMTNPNWHVRLEIPTRANDQGVFEWDWAPGDAVHYNFNREGYASLREVALAAADREHVQVLNSVLQISGTVRDAATGKTVEHFLAIPVVHFRPDSCRVERQGAHQERSGQFSLDFDRTGVEHGVQIEAPGYRTFRTSHRWRSGDANAALDIRLEPSPRYVGSLVDEAGRAVHDARVYLGSASEPFSPNDFQEPGSGHFDWNSRISTDPNGTFEIASQLEKYALFAISRDGYGEVQRAAGELPGQIRLRRWAKVSGRLLQSGKPVANGDVMLNTIRLGSGDEPHVYINLQTKTDDDGSFAFDRVPPVPCRVRGWLHFSAPSPLTSGPSIPLTPQPGETIRVTLGAPGIDVTGQLVVENQPAGFDYHFAINHLVARRPGIDPPAWLAGKGFDWKKGWSEAWQNSPEGGAYLHTLYHWFVKPEPDGRFRISGVEPGDYDFAVNLYGTVEGCLVHPIAQRVVHFSVKPGDSSLDLGKLSIPSLSLPKIGDTAGDFSFETLGGGKTSLAALRGNYVLIDFWATWCGSCVSKFDAVEHLREQFAGDKPLVVVGANLDADRQRAKDFLKSKPLSWQHALLGDWSSTDVPRRFAISGIPAYILIGPNGRIMAHENSLEAIASKLNRQQQEEHPLPQKRS
jgi:beta-lactamase regulating signal transducer with metallopeptidase domain/thiol-disulfide isomerase/thioredoxin